MKGFFIKTLAFLPLFLLFFLGDARQVFAQDIFWSTPKKIAPGGVSTDFAVRPDIATDSKGYVHAVWQQTANHAYQTTPPRTPSGIWYSFWNGDTWSTPQQLNTPAQGFPSKPSITITSNDDIHVVWDEDTDASPTYTQIWYTRYSGGSWSTPIAISNNQADYSWEWESVIKSDTSGNLHVTYLYTNNDIFEIYLYYTKYTAATSSWSTPVPISQGLPHVKDSSLAVDSSGNVHVLIWNDEMGSNGGIYYTFYNGSTWSSLSQIKSGFAVFPRLVIDGANNLHATWATIIPVAAGWETHVEYAQKPAAGSWSSPYVVSTTVALPWWAMPLTGLTVDSSNNVYVGWGQYNSIWYNDTLGPNNGSYGIDAMYRRRNTDGTWTAPNLIRSTKYLDAPTIWRDKWWNQHFVWSELNATSNQWEFWYSEVPANSSSYNPSSQMTITMTVTGDTLKIPNNALSANATISAQIGPVPASADPLVTTIPRSYTFRPHGTTFISGKTATATINYTDAELIGSDERNLKAYFWDATLNSGAGGWTSNSFSQSTNTNTNKLTATLPHFSLYGIRAPKITAQFQSPQNPYSGSSIPLSFKFINQVTGQPADPPAERTVMVENEDGSITPTPFWDEYKAQLVNNAGGVIETLNYDAGGGNLGYNSATNTYAGSFSGDVPEGDYTIEVYLASTIPTGSQTFHFTPQPSINVTFLPPLKDNALYTLKDGSTLPVKFTLTYENGTWVEAPVLPEDVIVIIRDSAGDPRAEYRFGTGDNNVRYDPTTNQYIANIHTKELGLGVGEYKIEVLVKGQAQAQSSTGSTVFNITEPGKVKGATAP